MDGGDRWRMVGCADGAHDKTIVNQIMLRFRPIAPKPANCTTSGLDSGQSFLYKKNNIIVSNRRNKRQYIRVGKNNNRLKSNRQQLPLSSSDQKKAKENDREQEDDGFNKTVTLQLMPERSDQLKDHAERWRSSWCNQVNNNDNRNDNNGGNDVFNQERALELKLKQPAGMMIEVADEMTATEAENFPKEKVVVESWVRVVCVTDTYEWASSCLSWMDGTGSGGLEEETRPGFISDGSNRVRWVNKAYKRMMVREEKKEDDEMSMEIKVWLVREEKLKPYLYSSGFTCWVSLEYYGLKDALMEKGKCSSQMVPCDVWKLLEPRGCFAWRLDMDAALSLGR